MKFKTDFIYTDRATKARYIYLKYKSILHGNIIDIGADECYLKKYLGENVKYTGIGLDSDKLDLEIDLESGPLPYKDNSFDVVLCFDVLEHLENIYDVFDELCRVAKKYVIISLPNPYSNFFGYLKYGNYTENQHIKFYGLPLEKPKDRHKWFFSVEEAVGFVKYRAIKNNMNIVQVDIEGENEGLQLSIKKLIYRCIFKCAGLTYTRNLHNGTLWAVLEKIG